MKKQLSIRALAINFVLAIILSIFIAPAIGASPLGFAVGFVAISTVVQYFAPSFSVGKAMFALQTEVWVAGIQENPVPDHSFVYQSRDMSQYVENNKLHLAEAGVEPQVYKNYFAGNEDPLPVASIEDIPNEVVLDTYSTAQTRHRQLQEVELQYDRRQSIIGRHRSSLAKNMSQTAAHEWAPQADGSKNKIITVGTDSMIDAIIDLEAFYADNDILDGINICLNADHMARIKKEDKTLYKEILSESTMYGFKVFRYSGNPLYTALGVKKPLGSINAGTDLRASFTWVTDEVFRCFGDTELYANLRDSGLQADTLSFAQRALVGKIRANSPKYSGAII